MGIAADIVKFFYTPNSSQPLLQAGKVNSKSLCQFMDHTGITNLSEILPVIHRLVSQGMLIPAGRYIEGIPPMNEKYYSPIYNSESANYGMYDFAAYGFPKIYNSFKDAVQAVVVIKESGDEDIGSGFLLKNRMFMTARHCIENMREIKITGWNHTTAPLSHIWIPTDDAIDLALLQFEADPFPNVEGFLCDEAKILDDVLTMGYPPILGYDYVLVAEKAQVAGLKSTTGQVVAEKECYITRQEHILISARVKGGNSGGPVITNQGCVTGVITQLPAGAEATVDILGYAAAIPFKTLKQLIDGCSNAPNEKVARLPFKKTSQGFFSTL
jgi:serine protease Do